MKMYRRKIAIGLFCLIGLFQQVLFAQESEAEGYAIWQHGFYAISSYSQMAMITQLDAVSFGWAQVIYTPETEKFEVTLNSENDYRFKIPEGFWRPIDFAKAHDVESYLMVFFEANDQVGSQLLRDGKDDLIEAISRLCEGVTQGEETRSFDGITIDFEGFRSEEVKVLYNVFLEELSKVLHEKGKKLNVAIPSTQYFTGYDYRYIGEVADKVILMAHDYEVKKLNEEEMVSGYIYTPLTPIASIQADIERCLDLETGIQEAEKLILQLSFNSVQWQLQEGKVINAYPYRPTYNKIAERLQADYVMTYFDASSGNPYMVFTEEESTHIVWYENEESVALKMAQIKAFGLGGVSYWRLGLIPEFILE